MVGGEIGFRAMQDLFVTILLYVDPTITNRVHPSRPRNRYLSQYPSILLAFTCHCSGGAERLVVDAALGLQVRGHLVDIYTSHHDPNHCFDETRDGEYSL